jgi:hypothetical protein
MMYGHREAQQLFLEAGMALGFEVKKSYSKEHPSDGVWLLGGEYGRLARLPVSAIEVVVSESPKAVSGSIHRLESISPALGIVVVHEDEIKRRMTRAGASSGRIEAAVAKDIERVENHMRRSKQRLERWSFAQLCWMHRLATSVRMPSSTVGKVRFPAQIN